jgi:hypothetical protein
MTYEDTNDLLVNRKICNNDIKSQIYGMSDDEFNEHSDGMTREEILMLMSDIVKS